MPPTGARINARIAERIAASEFTLSVFYADVRPKPMGTAPLNIDDVSLLMPTGLPTATSDEEPEQVTAGVTMKCLFTDAHQLADLRKQRLTASNGAWLRETTAMVRVLAADVELASGGLVFDGCKGVTCQGKTYTVLHAVRVAVSSERAGSYYVYLAGSVKS